MRKLIYLIAIALPTIGNAQCTDDFKEWSTTRIKGEIADGIYDNAYHDAKLDRDYKKMLELEAYMIALHNEIIRRGEVDDCGIPYDTFGNPKKSSRKLINQYKDEQQ